MSPKHLDRCVQVLADHHNIRNTDTLRRMGVVVRALEGRHHRLPPPLPNRTVFHRELDHEAGRQDGWAGGSDRPCTQTRGGCPRQATG